MWLQYAGDRFDLEQAITDIFLSLYQAITDIFSSLEQAITDIFSSLEQTILLMQLFLKQICLQVKEKIQMKLLLSMTQKELSLALAFIL